MDRNYEWSNKILVEDCFRLLEPSRPRLVKLKPKETFFSRGDRAESIFYLSRGFGKLTVSSKSKKQATIAFLVAGDFIGEEALTSEVGIRTTTATALTRCTALEIGRKAMIRIIQQEHACADLLLKSLLAKNSQFQEALVEKRFNSGSRRLARTLLLMAETGRPGGDNRSYQIPSPFPAETPQRPRSRGESGRDQDQKVTYSNVFTELRSSSRHIGICLLLSCS
jgi:CRP-like cAMP-binding protein